MILNDIAIEMKAILGDKYKIYVNNNAGQFVDIESGTTIQSQTDFQDDYINCILHKSSGDRVGIKDLFASSFNYLLEVYAPTSISVEDELEVMINTMNGTMNDTGAERYVITFDEPLAQGNIDIGNGNFYQVIHLAGAIAISDKSLFGNEFKVYIKNSLGDYIEVYGLLNANPTLTVERETKSQETSVIPLKVVNIIDSTLSLTIHAKNDSALAYEFIDYVLDASTLYSGGVMKTFDLKFTYQRLVNAVPTTIEKTWNCILTSLSFPISLGGYIIINATFERSV